MIFNKNVAKKTAEVLLQVNAIKLSPKEPFTWASGWKSPIYCDNRIVLSFPPIRNYIREKIAKHIERHYGKPDVIAGVATGAIGIGALVAEYLGLPFVYVAEHCGIRINLDAGAGYGRPLATAVFEGRGCWLLTEAGRVPLTPSPW